MKWLYSILLISFLFTNNAFSEEDPPSGAPEEVVLTFNRTGIKKTYISCYYHKEAVYIPIRQLFELFQINNTYAVHEGVIKGFFIEKDKSYEINFTSKTISNAGAETSFGSSDFLFAEGEYYILPEIVKAAFGLDFRIKMSNLSMTLSTEKALPLFMNFRRNNLRKSLIKDDLNETPFIFSRNRSILNGGFLDYVVTSNHKKLELPSYSYNFSSGTEILGGDLNVNVDGRLRNEADEIRTNASWRYVADNPIINQFILGNRIFSPGILPVQYKGGAVTNAPFGVRNKFSKYVLVDKTVPESDVELYINSELRDFTTANEFGDFSFDIPLNYGTTIIELKIYSPQGELIESSRKIQVPFDLLPDKEFQYMLSGGLKEGTSEKVFNGSLAFGITSWLTNKAGADYIEGDGFNKPFLYNSLSGRISDSYLFNITSVPELYHQFNFNASYISLQAFNLRYTRYKENNVYNRRRLKEDYQLNSSLPFEIFNSRHGFQLSGRYMNGMDFKTYRFEFSSVFSLLNMNPAFNFLYDDNNESAGRYIQKQFSAGLNFPLVGLDGLSFFEGKYIKARLSYDLIKKNVSILNLSYAHSLTRAFKVQLNYNRDFQSASSYFNVQLQYDFPFAVVNTNAYKDALNSTVQGSIGFNTANTGMLYSKRKRTGTSGVAIRMFEDKNSNGAFDEGESLIDDVNLKFGQNVKVERGEDGVLMAADLIPYSEYTADFVKMSGKNPLLVPKYQKIGLETDPNSFKPVDIPFYASEELNGYVVAEKDGKTIPLSNVKIHIQNSETGKITTIESYSDGSVYYLGLLPGKYTAVIDTAQMNDMGAVPIPGKIDFNISGNSETGHIADLNFILNKRESITGNTDTASIPGASDFVVQLGAFRYIENILKFSSTIKVDLQIEVEIVELPDGLFRLITGDFKKIEDAREYAHYIKARGYDAFLRKKE